MYNRLFTKILDSSIWLESDTTRLIWITFLATMDEDGFAPFSAIENLSRRANVALDDTKKAVEVLQSPDKYSPDDEFQGRRIERVEHGWLVLKAAYYRTLLTREIVREQTRLRVARHREKQKGVTNQPLANVTTVSSNTSEQSTSEYIQSISEQSTGLANQNNSSIGTVSTPVAVRKTHEHESDEGDPF